MAKTTLVNEKKNPPEITTSNPTLITQLKSEGYRVKDDAEKASAGEPGGDGSTATAPAKGKSGGNR